MSSLNDSFPQPSLPKLAADQVFHDLNSITSDDKPFRRYRYDSVAGVFSRRKFASGTFIWSIKQSTAAAPPLQPPSLDDSLSQTTSLDPNPHPSSLERNDEQREVDGTVEKPNWGLQMNSPRSILPDTLKEAPAWYNKNTWASAPLPSLSMRYQIHNPVGPRWYKNHHLIPPSLRHPSARPPSIFSASFPPMSTATPHERSDDLTRLSMLSRTPSNTPLPTPNSTQPGPFDSVGRPRSRKTSQTAHDEVDLLDATDPSGTNWHHQSPYDCGLVSSDKHELLTRPRRLSTTNLQTKRKPAPSPLSQSASVTHLPTPASYSIQAPRKLSKRRPPLSGGLFGQSHDRLTTSAPATPVDDSSIIPGPPPQNTLTRQTSTEPASSQSQTSKRERRGSFLTRLAKKFSLIRSSPSEPEGVPAEMEWQQSNYSRPSGEVNGYGYSHGHSYDAVPPATHPSPPKAPVEPPRLTPPINEPITTPGKDRNYEADRASAVSIEAPYSIGKLKVANPDVPTPGQNSPHPSEAPLPSERSHSPAHGRQPSVVSAVLTNAPTQLLSPLSTMGGLPEGVMGSRIFTEAPDSSSQRPVSHSRLDSSSRATPSPTDHSRSLARESPEREWAPSRPTSHREDPTETKPLPRVEGETSLWRSLEAKETTPTKTVPSRADPPVSGKRISRALEPKLAHSPDQREVVAAKPPSRRRESSPPRSAARGEDVPKTTYMPSMNGSSSTKGGDFSSSVFASLSPSWGNPAAAPPLPSKSPANRDKRNSSTARSSSYLTAPTPATARPASSQDHHLTPKHEVPTPTADQSPLSFSSLIVGPPTPYITSDRQISTTPEPMPPTVPPKSPRLPKHLQRESISQRSRQTETFRLIRSASGHVYASGETIVAAGEQWEVVESAGNAKSKNRNSFRPQETSSSNRKEVSQRPEKPKESNPSPLRNREHRDKARSERSRRQASEPGPIPIPVMTAQASQPQAKPTTHRRAPSMEPSTSSIPSRHEKHGRQEESKHSRRESSDHKKGSSESRRRHSPPNGQVNTVPFNVNKPQPVPPPTVNPGHTPQPRPLERAPSTNRPTSELPSAELNAVRAKEAWEMERLWKARTMYGVDPDNAPTTYSVPSEKSSSAGRESHRHNHHHQDDSRHHGSSHTSFAVSGTFQQQPLPSQIYHSMPLSPPPIIYQAPPSHASSHRSSTSAVHPAPTSHRHGHSYSHSHSSGHRPVIAITTTPSAGTTTTSSRPYSTARTPLNPLPEPPRESTYELPSRSSKQYSGITLAH